MKHGRTVVAVKDVVMVVVVVEAVDEVIMDAEVDVEVVVDVVVVVVVVVDVEVELDVVVDVVVVVVVVILVDTIVVDRLVVMVSTYILVVVVVVREVVSEIVLTEVIVLEVVYHMKEVCRTLTVSDRIVAVPLVDEVEVAVAVLTPNQGNPAAVVAVEGVAVELEVVADVLWVVAEVMVGTVLVVVAHQGPGSNLPTLPRRPTALSVNQILSADSTAIPSGELPGVGAGYSMKTFAAGTYLPILFAPYSVNQTFPRLSTAIS